MEIEIKFFDDKIKDKFKVEYQSQGSAAVDVRAVLEQPYRLLPGGAFLIPTGFAVHISETDVAGILMPRSGFAYKEGLILANTVGLIDSDYQSQIFVAALNRNTKAEILINPYDRIAQLMFVPIVRARLKQVDEFTDYTKRGGFGSTGKT